MNKKLTLLFTILALTVLGLLFNTGCKETDVGLLYDINGAWDFVLTFNSSTVVRMQELTFTGTGLTGNVTIEGETVGVYIVEVDDDSSVTYNVTIVIEKEEIYTYTFVGTFKDEQKMSGSFILVEEGVTTTGTWVAEQ